MTAKPNLDDGIRFINEGERLAHELARIAICVPSNRVMNRMRFAVTPLEYQQIEEYAMKRDGYAVGMIKGIRLVVENDPLSEDFHVRVV